MNVARAIARALCALAFVLVGIGALQGVAIVGFILAGTLVPGEPLFGGGITPSLPHATAFSLAALAASALLALARHKLRAGSKPMQTGRHVGA